MARTTTKSKPKAKAPAKKKAVATKKVSRSTKATKSNSLQRTDWLVVTWVSLIAVFLVVVIKVYVIG